MTNPYVSLDAPLVKEASPSSVSGKGKALAFVSLFVGLGLIVLWSAGSGQDPAAQVPITTMALTNVMQPTSQLRSMSPPVHSALNTLKTYGIGSSQMERLALTAIDANNQGRGMREVAMMASRSDRNIQVWLAEAAGAVEEKAAEIAETPAPTAAPTAPPFSIQAKDMPGITQPLGFWDDWGFSAPIPNEQPFSGARLLFYRQAELKHGRVGMIASLGIIVGENFHPLFGGKLDGIAANALQETSLESFWPALLVAVALTEVVPNGLWIRTESGWTIDTNTIPGDLGWDPLGLKPKNDPKALLEMQNKEINNGRLGMLAAAGMIAQELVTGEPTFR